MGTQSLRCGPLCHVIIRLIENEIGGRASVESRIKLNREPLEEMTREYSRHERGLECLSRQFPRRLSPPLWQEALIIFRFHKFSYVLYVGCLERNLVWGKYIRSSIYRWNIFINYIQNNREKKIIIDELKFCLFMKRKIYDSLKLWIKFYVISKNISWY